MTDETVEMTAEEAKLLRGSKALMDKLLSPKTRREAEKLIKSHYPETTTTDDIVEPYVSEFREATKEFKDFVKSQRDGQIDSKFNQQLQQLKDQGYTDEGLEKIKKLMVDESLPNALAAAAYWEKLNPPKPAEPSAFAPTDWGFGRKSDDASITELFQDEDAWAEKEARRAWNEEVQKKGQILT